MVAGYPSIIGHQFPYRWRGTIVSQRPRPQCKNAIFIYILSETNNYIKSELSILLSRIAQTPFFLFEVDSYLTVDPLLMEMIDKYYEHPNGYAGLRLSEYLEKMIK